MATVNQRIFRIAFLCLFLSPIFIASAAYPADKISEKTQTARSGSIAVLHCKPSDGRQVRWFYQQSPGVARSEIYFNGLLINGYTKLCEMDVSDDGEWNLILKTVAADSAGTYSCIENNGQGDYHLIHLSVNQSESAPESVGERSLTAVVGSTVVLHCKPRNGQTVRWFYKQSLAMRGSEIYFNGQLVNGYRDICEMDTSADGEWNLIIKDVKADSNGLYMCIEDNGQGDYHIIHLDVVLSDSINGNASLTTTTTHVATRTLTDDAVWMVKSNYNPAIIATAAVTVTVTAIIGFIAAVLYRRQSKKLHEAVADGEARTQLMSNMEIAASEQCWMRVEQMKTDLLPPAVPATSLHRWTSDEFVHEVIQYPDCFAACVDKLEKQARQLNVDVIFGVNVNDSRGEIFAKPLAKRLGIRYEPIWPAVLMDEEGVLTSSYFETRFGHETRIGIRADACKPGDRVLIVDSYVITARIKETASELIERELHGKVVGFIVFAAAPNEHLPRWPLYSVFPPYFKQDQFHLTDEGLHVYVPPENQEEITQNAIQ